MASILISTYDIFGSLGSLALAYIRFEENLGQRSGTFHDVVVMGSLLHPPGIPTRFEKPVFAFCKDERADLVPGAVCWMIPS